MNKFYRSLSLGRQRKEINQCSPTQHSITRSRVSLAQTTSLGSRSDSQQQLISKKVAGINKDTNAPEIIFATVALGSERSSSVGGGPPDVPSRSDIVQKVSSSDNIS